MRIKQVQVVGERKSPPYDHQQQTKKKETFQEILKKEIDKIKKI